MRLAHQLEGIVGKSDGLGYPHDFGHLFFHPTVWYSAHWPAMRAFALPSFSEGYVRINLRGREAAGLVAPDEYEAVCNEVTAHIRALTNARTGKPLAKEVVRVRQSAFDRDPKLPDADLIISWHDEPADVVESPSFGRIGPVPYGRTGSHVNRGFVLAEGPGIEPGSTLPEGRVIDVAPTLLSLLGAPVPEYMEGKPLLRLGSDMLV